MLEMKPRTKIVADLPHARLSVSDIICIFAQDVASTALLEDNSMTCVKWGDTDGRTRADVVKSLLTCMTGGETYLWYEGGVRTSFSFQSISAQSHPWFENNRKTLTYKVEAKVNPRNRDEVVVTLFKWDSFDAIYKNIASTTLSYEYFDDMHDIAFSGSDEDWEKVED